MTTWFAPGCALELHRPDLARRLHGVVEAHLGPTGWLGACCRDHPVLNPGSRVVNVCPGCDRRYRELYDGTITTVSVWQILAAGGGFSFPDYGGTEMAIHDACPIRTEARVHDAVRAVLARMNVTAVEPAFSGTRSVCCGDSFFGLVPEREVREQMAKRAETMPREDVVVYCVSCIKSMHLGGKTPRYLVDLLFGEPTAPGTFEPSAWHAELDAFIAARACDSET